MDPTRFRGTCYRAAGWEALGRTQGYARHAGRYRSGSHPKLSLIYPLHRRVQEMLSAVFLSPELPVYPRALLDFNRVSLEGLRDIMHEFKDLRNPQGQRHRYHAVLCLAVLGWFAGQRSYRGIGRWVKSLPQSVLERVGCARDGGGGLRGQRPYAGIFMPRIPRHCTRRSVAGWRRSRVDSRSHFASCGRRLRTSS